MKRFALCFGLLVLAGSLAFGQSPYLVNYQGRLLDNGGVPVNGNVTVSVSLFAAATGGSAVYTESIGSVSVANGLYSFNFGANSASFLAALGGSECWIEVSINGSALAPRQRLVSVPFALNAANVKSDKLVFSNGAKILHDGYDLLFVSPDGVTTSRMLMTAYTPNVAPTAVYDSTRTVTGTPIVINVLTNDTDTNPGDVLTVASVGTPTNAAGAATGSVSINSGATNVTYTPPAGYTGMVWFAYTLSDGRGGSVLGQVGVEVVPSLFSLYLIVDVSAGPTATTYPVTPSATEPADLLTNPEYKTTKIVLRYCPAGTFWMCGQAGEYGQDSWDADEVYHQVTLTKAFYMCVFEVTVTQWENVMGSAAVGTGGAKRPKCTVLWASIRGNEGNPANPPAASSFVGKLSSKTGRLFDLPTEARWEYACRAGTTTSLNSGQNITSDQGACPNLDALSWYAINGGSAHDVGLKLPNAWRLFDMHGNAYEFTIDFWIPGTAWVGEVIDPNGPDAPDQYNRHVAKGSCFIESAQNHRSGDRWAVANSVAEDWYGFRVIAESN